MVLNNNKIIVFFLILVIISNIVIHIIAIDKSNNNRSVIWEPDDNYHQLIKAKNLNTCKKNCLGINNLTDYKYDFFKKDKKKLLEMYLHHTAIEYHYLKSKILILVNKYINDWEKSQILITKVVSSFLIILLALSLKLLLKKNLIVLIGSIITLPYVQIKYGFHFSNGSDDLATIFGILSLIFITKLKIKRIILSIIFSTLAIFTHPIGIFMLVFNFIFIFIKSNFKLKKNLLLYYIISSCIVYTYFNLDLNYIKSSYNFTSLYNSYSLDYKSVFRVIYLNAKMNTYFIYDIFNLLNPLIIILTLYILRNNFKKIFLKYDNLLPLFASSVVIIILSFFHYAPEASIITRMQQILTLSIVSIYAVIIYESYKNLLTIQHKIYFISFFILIFSCHSLYNFHNLNKKINSNIETLNITFNIDKIKDVLEVVDDKKYIVFKNNNTDLSTFKSIYYKFLLEGFNNKNIHLDEFILKNDLKNILTQNFLLVLPSPIINNNLVYKEQRPNCFHISSFYKCINRAWYGKSRTRMADLLFYGNEIIKIDTKKVTNIKIGINNFNNNIYLIDRNGKEIFVKKNSQTKFIQLNKENFDYSEFIFRSNGAKYIKINGIKILDDKDSNWPWGEGVNLKIKDQKMIREFNFNLKKMMGKYYCNNYELIDDSSSYIIINMKCEK